MTEKQSEYDDHISSLYTASNESRLRVIRCGGGFGSGFFNARTTFMSDVPIAQVTVNNVELDLVGYSVKLGNVPKEGEKKQEYAIITGIFDMKDIPTAAKVEGRAESDYAKDDEFEIEGKPCSVEAKLTYFRSLGEMEDELYYEVPSPIEGKVAFFKFKEFNEKSVPIEGAIRDLFTLESRLSNIGLQRDYATVELAEVLKDAYLGGK